MSRYSDKKSKAACTARHCEAPATKLLLMSGKPWWVCDQHYDELSRQNASA